MPPIFNLAAMRPGDDLSLVVSRQVVEKLEQLNCAGDLAEAIDLLASEKPYRNGFVVSHFQGHSHLFMQRALADEFAATIRDWESYGNEDTCLGSLAHRIEICEDHWQFFVTRMFQDFSVPMVPEVVEKFCLEIKTASPTLGSMLRAAKYGKGLNHESAVVSHFNGNIHLFFDTDLAEEIACRLKDSKDEAMMALVDILRDGLEQIELSNAA